jgi:hypothetical protein
VLQSGETSGEDRLGFLQKGLLHQLAAATKGIGVVLEHRYYGTSIPTENFSTENLRFLTTDQALADQAFWSKNIVFPGLEGRDLTAGSAPHIAYGGSYAGAFVAFLRKLYPDVYWGEFLFFLGDFRAALTYEQVPSHLVVSRLPSMTTGRISSPSESMVNRLALRIPRRSQT